ncbi:MAG: hypothetical protein AAF488_11465 [Planctomycetota bacterium]
MVLLVFALSLNAAPAPDDATHKKSGSRRPYSHVITLYDAREQAIDPTAETAAPYSPSATCRKCHDVAKIHTGHHFAGSTTSPSGRPGEPWIWVDRRTGTQLPLSYRDWPGTYRPEALGIDAEQFTETFGRHLPGTGFTANEESDPLEIDCLSCHLADRDYRHPKWMEAVSAGTFDVAPTLAAGIGKKSAEDPSRIVYDTRRFESDGTIFIDVVRRPPNESCYGCHTVKPVGDGATPRWLHEGDVHLAAGLDCVDCHTNGLDHHTVRGFPGESADGHPAATLSCEGCHGGVEEGDGAGHFGAPRPEHRGLPPLHLETMSCTSCHSGFVPSDPPHQVQTSMAHSLGVASQDRRDDDAPQIVTSILARDDRGVLTPHRQFWPSFWGWQAGETVTPIAPSDVTRVVRRAFRVRQDFAREVRKGDGSVEELEVTFREKLGKAFAAMAKQKPSDDAQPVYVSGGQLYRTARSADAEPKIEAIAHPAAAPYRWPVAHDVRPARAALGATGCTECHSPDAPMLHATITAIGPAPSAQPVVTAAHETAKFDPVLLSTWERSFEGRDLFKGLAAVAVAVIALALATLLIRSSRRSAGKSDAEANGS